jgi:uncharacterized protein
MIQLTEIHYYPIKSCGGTPFAEDRYQTIRIGEVTFHLVKPCSRCVTTTVDQATG